eukprot:COSAG03_NODE_874_length_5533_cov_5.221936_4_plen_179_part_00
MSEVPAALVPACCLSACALWHRPGALDVLLYRSNRNSYGARNHVVKVEIGGTSPLLRPGRRGAASRCVSDGSRGRFGRISLPAPSPLSYVWTDAGWAFRWARQPHCLRWLWRLLPLRRCCRSCCHGSARPTPPGDCTRSAMSTLACRSRLTPRRCSKTCGQPTSTSKCGRRAPLARSC